jgi:hypothetical protein
MKLVVQIKTIGFYHANTSNLQKAIQLQTQNMMDDFKCTFSNLQHQDNKIITNYDTPLDFLGFPT